MDTTAYLDLIRGRRRDVRSTLLRAGLGVMATGYRIGYEVHQALRRLGWERPQQVGLPVISVGNLTLGGTGKTPMVEWLARDLRGLDLRVAILSRGYKGQGAFNDEGLLLEENLPDVPHLQGRDRVASARIASEELAMEAIVLDDGFQHRRLVRDFDLILVDALDPEGSGGLFPRGLLREPLQAARRADAVALTRADLIGPEDRAAIRRRFLAFDPSLIWAECRHAPRDLIGGPDGPEPIPEVASTDQPPHSGSPRVAAFCGLGNPSGFLATLAQCGLAPANPDHDFRAFPDHHPYRAEDVEELARWAVSRGAELVLTTQKDWVKLRLERLGPVPLRALRIGIDWLEGREPLRQAIHRVVLSQGPIGD